MKLRNRRHELDLMTSTNRTKIVLGIYVSRSNQLSKIVA